MDSRRKSIPDNIVIAIVGPTAVGKSKTSLELAKKINGEIISCDSMQVYREMEVITSKPSTEARAVILHHLVDILGVNEAYSAADFSKQAEEAIIEIHRRQRIPLVVGGSGLYVKALIDGMFPDGGADWKVRRRLYQQAREKGSEELYQRLEQVDPRTASQLYPQDARRIVRALEVWEVNGIPMSKLREKTAGIGKLYPIKILGLIRERSELYQRINQRVERMLNEGLVDEVKRLSQLEMSHSAKQVLGYKEVKGFLEGQYPLDEAERLLKRNTRRFAKRQLSWFRRDKRIIWVKINKNQSTEEIAERLAISCKL